MNTPGWQTDGKLFKNKMQMIKKCINRLVRNGVTTETRTRVRTLLHYVLTKYRHQFG